MKEFSNKQNTNQKVNSYKVLIFFLNLRRSLLASNLTVQNFVNYKLNLKNQKQISQSQFVKIVSFSQSKFQALELYEIYNEIKIGNGIPIDVFIYRYHKIDQNHPIQKMKEIQQKKNFNKNQSEKQLQKKMIRLGLTKLQKYVRQNSPIQLFEECDDENKGYLTKQQFNKFLIATDIKELNDKIIRTVLIKKLFNHYQNQRMKKQQFMALFKIDLQTEQKRLQKKRSQNTPNTTIDQISQPKVQQPSKQVKPFHKKKLIFEKQPDLREHRSISLNDNPRFITTQSQTFESDQVDLLDARSAFPRSYSLYRLGIPSPEQYPSFQILQGYLQSNREFHDTQNPKTSIGEYVPSNAIFGGQKYEIFQMAASVLNRQKSRIGLARQIQPKDIIQGQVGDCYLMSSIASIISIYPQVVSDKFLFAVNRAHFYAVKLFIDGQWKVFCTDDNFPCQYGNRPVYAKPHGRQIWVMLLEKCWAKQFGSYQKIDAGTPTEGFRAITGAPTQYFTTDNKQDQVMMQNRLKQAYQKRYVATCSGSDILSKMSEKQQQKIGLISDHAYSFLKFLQINGENVVKMRNPWGKTVWKGQWSFQSKKWTKQLRDKYNYHHQPDDGSFYIPWNLFIKYFSNFVICRLDPTATHTSNIFKTQPHKSNYFKLIIKEDGHYNFSVYQKSKRKVGLQNYEYSPVRLIVAHQKKGQIKYVTSVNKSSHGVSCEANVQAGIYYVAIKLDWQGRKMMPCTLSIYGQGKVDCQSISNSIAPFFKKGVIESYSNIRKGKVKQYGKIKIPEAFNQIYFSIAQGIGYLRIKNPSNKPFITTYTMKNFSGIKFIKPDKLPQKFDMKPGSQYIVGFWVSSRGYSYESSQSMQTIRW